MNFGKDKFQKINAFKEDEIDQFFIYFLKVLKKMSPLKYENYLAEIKEENRKKMTIYTVDLNEDKSLNKQLDLFNPL
ncbi:MAG: hypothetical protein H0V14_05910 [Chitinophagaceae bacterium]|jgi:competence CoiA-like predicted nuclease|nr:hypothetical protein [Chitinophagaceae bacterium]